MALLQVNTFSQALSRIITFHIILPNDAPPEILAGNSNYDRPMKTLYLLHGLSDSPNVFWQYAGSSTAVNVSYPRPVPFPFK